MLSIGFLLKKVKILCGVAVLHYILISVTPVKHTKQFYHTMLILSIIKIYKERNSVFVESYVLLLKKDPIILCFFGYGIILREKASVLLYD